MHLRRGLPCAALLLFIALPLTVDGISATAYGGWPAIGFSAALFFVCGRAHARLGFALQTVVVALGLCAGYHIDLWLALPASLTVTLPAVMTAALLGWGDNRPDIRLDMIDSDRYHLVTALAAVACAGLGGVAELTQGSPRDALLAALMSFMAALSAQLVVLPLVIGESTSQAIAGRVELWCLRALTVLLGGATLWFGSAGVLIFVLFTLLGWSARRATPREAHIHLFAVCVAAYAFAVIGRGPLVTAPAGIPDALAPCVFYLFAIAACYLVVPMTLAVEELVNMTQQAQRAATTVERLFASAVGTVFIATDAKGVVTHFNTGAEMALGFTADEVVGTAAGMTYPEEELQRHAAHFGVPATRRDVVFAQAQRGERRDWTLIRKDGGRRTLSLSLSPVYGPEGALVGMIASGEDISERLRAEKALAAALERELASVRGLQRVNQVKEDLVSTVSHELRTPITSIAGYAELLVDEDLGPLNERQADALERIERNTTRLGILVEDLLTMSRAESGQLELQCRRLDLRIVAREAFDTLYERQDSDSPQVELRLPDEPVLVTGDRVALIRATENLLANAIKFTPVTGLVTVSVRPDAAGYCSLVVSDTGLGIPQEDVPHVFDRFFRSANATEQAIQGSGLGLNIVHAIVTRHGGEVSVESRVGEGTQFSVRLPALLEAPPPQSMAPVLGLQRNLSSISASNGSRSPAAS